MSFNLSEQLEFEPHTGVTVLWMNKNSVDLQHNFQRTFLNRLIK